MRIEKPADWVTEHLRRGVPFFTTRINDGEMIQMFRSRPEGSPLGTVANPATTKYEVGDAFWDMLIEMKCSSPEERSNVMIGCSSGTNRVDELAKRFEKEWYKECQGWGWTWANEHWPLDGVVDGSTMQMLETVRMLDSVLVGPASLETAVKTVGYSNYFIQAPTADSWDARHVIYEECRTFAVHGRSFVWAAGAGLKPTAWKLFRDFPQSSHIDVGHLFNGAVGLTDYGWLERKDGPWYNKYFSEFVPWFRSKTNA